MSQLLLYISIILSICMPLSEGHGRFIEPPSRASMWRYGFDTPPNYQDNELFCGGRVHQWNTQGGKCGICGDAWDANPRPHEGGPNTVYATGTIARTYNQGDIIVAKAEITANHLGWFEFRLCVHNDVSTAANQECLDRNLLTVVSKNGEPVGSTRVEIGSQMGVITMELALPPDVICEQCVMQWKYHTGNSWGYGPDGVGCLGCSEEQEEFYGCADVAIEPIVTSNIERTTTTNGTPTTTIENLASTSGNAEVSSTTTQQESSEESQTQPTGGHLCVAAGKWKGQQNMTKWCQSNCPENCPETHCSCVNSAGCHALGLYHFIEGMDDWCMTECIDGTCPEMCTCDPNAPTLPTLKEDPYENCRAVGPLFGNSFADRSCRMLCRQSYCPYKLCEC